MITRTSHTVTVISSKGFGYPSTPTGVPAAHKETDKEQHGKHPDWLNSDQPFLPLSLSYSSLP